MENCEQKCLLDTSQTPVNLFLNFLFHFLLNNYKQVYIYRFCMQSAPSYNIRQRESFTTQRERVFDTEKFYRYENRGFYHIITAARRSRTGQIETT